MDMTVRQMLGQKLIFGFQGETLSEEIKELIREYKIGNVILFLRNCRTADQLRRLCAEIQELILAETGCPAFIVIDQEGGMVTRLPSDAVNVPGAMAIAATGDPENARIASEITIRQLRGLGANFNMAPVLDVNNNPANPVIGVRSFGDIPEQVAAFGVASAQPYEGSGILCCGKHFPGHGDTAVDSHLGLPRVDKTLEELERVELVPFRAAVEAGIPAIMISHVMFPNIVKEEVPCTMSREIITGLLKEKMGFQGLVLTDCMEMDAIQDFYGTPEGVLASFKAGVDLAEISLTTDLMRGAAELVNAAAERGELDMEEIRASVEKILEYKKKICYQLEPELCNREEDRRAAAAMARQAITLCAGSAPLADENTFFCGCADYRVSGAGNDQGAARTFSEYMSRAFHARGLVTSKNPDSAEIEAVVAQAADAEQIILATCNGHLFRGQITLAHALAKTGKPMTVVALRNPYDIPLLPRGSSAIAAYEYSIPVLTALEEIFRGGRFTGRLPVNPGSRKFIAGIDGGGTHTRIELRTLDNGVICREEFGPFNLNAIGEEAFRALLKQVFAFCGDMTLCESICFGAAGISNPRVGAIVEEELKATKFSGKWKLCGDMEIALRGAMDTPGVAVIAGTGSICFAKDAAGETARSGGYGHIIDDGGSGYCLGRDFLSSAVRAIDGRSDAREVLEEVYRRLGASAPGEIVSFVYSKDTDKAAIAKFAESALKLAASGSRQAQKILEHGAEELSELVQAVQRKLDLPGCTIALLGGLLSSANPYRDAVVAELSKLGNVIAPAHDALWGAAQMAWELI